MLKKAMVCGAIVCLMAGYGYGSAKGADFAKGKTLFTSRCVLCHGAEGKGNGPAAMTLSPKPADFTSKTFWQTPDIDRTMTDFIKNGKGPMPAFPDLSAGDIQDVVQYIEHAFKPK
ncbi:MAG: cytochrome c [Syntrophobacteraceae bacterium]|nr:cytochrome c [Syntrophobacteraceae bacterium]